MDKSREFLVSPSRLMLLAMELATLSYSHEGMCKWLGPYEREQEEEDYVAEFYKEYYEERLSYLLLTLALLLRTLDDRKLIDRGTSDLDPVQIELGKISTSDCCEDINNLRTVLNFIIHAKEVITSRDSTYLTSRIAGVTVSRPVERLNDTIQIVGKLNNKKEACMQLHIRSFCDMVFRVVERLK